MLDAHINYPDDKADNANGLCIEGPSGAWLMKASFGRSGWLFLWREHGRAGVS